MIISFEFFSLSGRMKEKTKMRIKNSNNDNLKIQEIILCIKKNKIYFESC